MLYENEYGEQMNIVMPNVMDKFRMINFEDKMAQLTGVGQPMIEQEATFDNEPLFVHTGNAVISNIPQFDVNEKLRQMIGLDVDSGINQPMLQQGFVQVNQPAILQSGVSNFMPQIDVNEKIRRLLE